LKRLHVGVRADLYFWAAASLAFAVMSFFGSKEKAKNDEQERARYAADVQAAAAANSNHRQREGKYPAIDDRGGGRRRHSRRTWGIPRSRSPTTSTATSCRGTFERTLG